jgi:hypothetical protein
VYPVLNLRALRERLSNRKMVLLLAGILVVGGGYIAYRQLFDGEGDMVPFTGLSLSPVAASASPSSDIYAVTGTNGADDGVERLLGIMAGDGLKFYKSVKQGPLNGPDGLIAFDDVVLIKVNSQWDQRGGTNTDLVKSLIQQIVDHPDGFRGEVVVADNGQSQYGSAGHGGNLDWGSSNAQDHGQSMVDVVNSFKPGHRISAYLWDRITATVVSEFADGDMEDGYVVSTRVAASTSSISAYPKFTT